MIDEKKRQLTGREELLAAISERDKISEQPETSLSSKASTVGHALADVASFGFGDELEGNVRAILQGGTDPDLEIANVRERYKQAAAENPGLHLGTEIAGNIALGFVPGLGITKAASIPMAALKSGVIAGLQGLGASEEKEISGQLKDAAISSLVGGLIGGGTQAASKLVPKGIEKIKSKLFPVGTEVDQGLTTATAKGVLPSISEGAENIPVIDKIKGIVKKGRENIFEQAFDLPKEKQALLSNPEIASKIKNLRNAPEAGEEVLSNIQKIVNERNSAKGLSDMFLRPQYQYKPEALKNLFSDLKAENTKINPETFEGVIKNLSVDDAIKGVENEIDRLATAGDISETDIKKIVLPYLDNQINYNTTQLGRASDPENSALKAIRSKINSQLKSENPEYSKHVEVLAEKQGLLNEIGKKFGLRENSLGDIADEDLMSLAGSNQLLSKLKQAEKPTEIDTRKLLGKINPEIVSNIDARVLDATTDSGVTQGSRKVNLGGVIGAVALGGAGGFAAEELTGSGPVGAAIGATAGAILDKKGRGIAKEFLINRAAKQLRVPADELIKTGFNKGANSGTLMKFKNTEFFEPLRDAMIKGGSAYIQQDFLFSSKFPQYRKIKSGEVAR